MININDHQPIHQIKDIPAMIRPVYQSSFPTKDTALSNARPNARSALLMAGTMYTHLINATADQKNTDHAASSSNSISILRCIETLLCNIYAWCACAGSNSLPVKSDRPVLASLRASYQLRFATLMACVLFFVKKGFKYPVSNEGKRSNEVITLLTALALLSIQFKNRGSLKLCFAPLVVKRIMDLRYVYRTVIHELHFVCSNANECFMRKMTPKGQF